MAPDLPPTALFTVPVLPLTEPGYVAEQPAAAPLQFRVCETHGSAVQDTDATLNVPLLQVTFEVPV